MSPYTKSAAAVACVILTVGLAIGVDIDKQNELIALTLIAAIGAAAVGFLLPIAVAFFDAFKNGE